MRNHSKVAPQFWTGRTGRAIRAEGKEAIIAAVYLMTCPSANMIGLYYLPMPTMSHESGLTLEESPKALRSLSKVHFAFYDSESEVVYVPKMAKFQIGLSLKPKDNQIIKIVKLLEQYKHSSFIKAFHDEYRSAFHLPALEFLESLESPSLTPSQTPSKPGTGSGAGTGEGSGTGQEEPPHGGMSPTGDPASALPSVRDVLDLWNSIPGAKSVQFDRLTAGRGLHKRITVLTRQAGTKAWDWWRETMKAVDEQKTFLFSGANKRQWVGDLPWVLRPENLAKVRERRYVDFTLPSGVSPKLPGLVQRHGERDLRGDSFEDVYER
jgi:hypothetical protein